VLIGLMGRLLAGRKAMVGAIVLLQLVQTSANLLLPTLNAAIIDDGIVGRNPAAIADFGVLMAVTATVQVLAAVAACYLGAVIAMDMGRQLREELFSKVQSFSSQEVAALGAASLVTRATSSVDSRTEVQIRQAMRRLRHGRTSFVIAHRLSTVRDADLILVMDHGRIVEHGTHHQLLAGGGLYTDLYAAQFARREQRTVRQVPEQ
jgi:ABC-type multidrug transport system fused ATPase/permease subunit